MKKKTRRAWPKDDIFRDAIEEELERRGWTAYRLVQETGLSPSGIYKYLSGETGIFSSSLSRICETLDLSLKPIRKRRSGY